MASKEKAKSESVAKTKKVTANYPASEPRLNLWGVTFTLEGEGKDACYVAEVDADTAKDLIDAGRAK